GLHTRRTGANILIRTNIRWAGGRPHCAIVVGTHLGQEHALPDGADRRRSQVQIAGGLIHEPGGLGAAGHVSSHGARGTSSGGDRRIGKVVKDFDAGGGGKPVFDRVHVIPVQDHGVISDLGVWRVPDGNGNITVLSAAPVDEVVLNDPPEVVVGDG